MARRDPDTGKVARLVGLSLVLAGIVAFVALPAPYSFTMLFAGASTGLFIALVAATPSVPRVVVNRILAGASEQSAGALGTLGLAGRATYVPPGEGLSRDRVFIAASDSAKPVPLLADDTGICQGPPEYKSGMVFIPAAVALVEGHVAAVGSDVASAPLHEAEAFLRGLGLEYGLFRDFRVASCGDRLVVGFEPMVMPPCRALSASDPPCDRSGCALCSAVGCTLARSMGRPLPVIEAGPDGKRITMAFEAGARDASVSGAEGDRPSDVAGSSLTSGRVAATPPTSDAGVGV